MFCDDVVKAVTSPSGCKFQPHSCLLIQAGLLLLILPRAQTGTLKIPDSKWTGRVYRTITKADSRQRLIAGLGSISEQSIWDLWLPLGQVFLQIFRLVPVSIIS